MANKIARTLEAWSRQARSTPSASTELVVLVPPDEVPQVGIPVALRLASQRTGVRLIGRSVTSPRFTVHFQDAPSLALTELDAYLPADQRPSQRALALDVKCWLDKVFGDSVRGVEVSEAFWASASTRLGLQRAFEAKCLINGLAEQHGRARFVVTAPWFATPLLADLVAKQGGSVEGGRLPPIASAARELGEILLALGAAPIALLTRAFEFLREAPARKLVAAIQPASLPRVWVGINGNWEHSSRHVLQVAREARGRGERVGVILQSSLQLGDLGGARRESRRRAVLPTLASDALKGGVLRVGQVISHATWPQLLGSFPGTLGAMLRCTGRAAIAGMSLDFGAFRFGALGPPAALAKLVTLDVLRAREAAAATARFIEGNSVRGAHIVLSQASVVADVVPDRLLQAAGATTFDVVHGGLTEPLVMISHARTFSSEKVLWTNAEAAYLADHVPNHCVGGVPPRDWRRRPREAPHAPMRVLVMSNYATFTNDGPPGRMPRLGYQDHLLADTRVLANGWPRPLELRWRPHPSDERTEIERAVGDFGEPLVLSQGTTLEQDLDWADVLLTSLSSTVVEALAWDKPILVHDIPIYETEVLMSLFDPARRFRNGVELRRAFDRAAEELDRGLPLSEEDALRERFFGPQRAPRSVSEIVLKER